MISEICPLAHQRYLSLPVLGPILDEFTEWALQQGYSFLTVWKELPFTASIDDLFRKRGIKQLGDLQHADFDAAWQHFHQVRPCVCSAIRQIERFLDETRGMKPPLSKPKTPADSETERFAGYLRDIRGLQKSTIRDYITYIHRFLVFLGYDKDAETLANLTPKEIEGFLVESSSRLNRHSLQKVAGHLRAFLRYQHELGVIKTPLHTMVDAPRVYRFEKLPRALPWETVKALLSSIDRTDAHGIRDYTMLFLIATYGLRPSEVVSLTLDDIDWRAEIIKIRQRKTGSLLMLPLIDAAGEVLIEYLKTGRKSSPFRELFLRANAPIGPLHPGAVADIFRRRVRLSGLDIDHDGPYCLRHSYATHLLRQGTSVKAIGDLLGHRTVESTGAYLRLSTDDLRNVALPVPKGPAVEAPVQIIVSDWSTRTRHGGSGVKRQAIQLDSFRSFLARDIRDYLDFKRSFGWDYVTETRMLLSFDAFLANSYPQAHKLGVELVNDWYKTLNHLTPAVRCKRMRVVRKFCQYRQRSDANAFVPDAIRVLPDRNSFAPYIFSEGEIALLLSATRFLSPCSASPLRPQTIRIAILLLYTTGLRRGELLGLKLGDLDPNEATLLIRDTKFHKSRLVPLSDSVAEEVAAFLALRHKARLPMEMTSPLMWNGRGGPDGRSYTGTGLTHNWEALCKSLGIFTLERKTPRIHDLRHSFAVNVLRGWYRSGQDVGAKLPLLSTYLGHVSIASTHHYLSFVETIRSEASERFNRSFGTAVSSVHHDSQGGGA